MDARRPPAPHLRRRAVLLVGAFVVGWSVGRSVGEPATAHPHPESATAVPPPARGQARSASTSRPRRRRRLPILVAAVVVLVLATAGGLAASPDDASAPLVAPAVAARERAAAAKLVETTRLTRLRHLQLSGIADRRVGPQAAKKPKRVLPPLPVVHPSERAVALDTYVQALGVDTILQGLAASRDLLQERVLHDPRVHIYPGGIGDVESGKVDVRVLAMIEYLAQADGEVTVTCLISGHSYF